MISEIKKENSYNLQLCPHNIRKSSASKQHNKTSHSLIKLVKLILQNDLKWTTCVDTIVVNTSTTASNRETKQPFMIPWQVYTHWFLVSTNFSPTNSDLCETGLWRKHHILWNFQSHTPQNKFPSIIECHIQGRKKDKRVYVTKKYRSETARIEACKQVHFKQWEYADEAAIPWSHAKFTKIKIPQKLLCLFSLLSEK